MASKFNGGGVYITSDIEDSAFKKKLKEMSAKAAEMAENVNKSTEKISKSGFGKLSSALKGLGSSIAGLSAGFAALFAVKKIVSFTKEWEKLYKVQEQAETKLAQMMKNTGVYTKENFNEMKQYAAELQNISNYGDEFLMPIIADLSKAKLSTEQLKEATKAAVDLMAGGQSADMLSKVLEKPLEMSQSLRRMGILINQEELKSLSLEEQRAKILDEINKKYGGMAEALANPAEQLKNALGDLKEVLGSGVSKTLEPVYRYLTKIINSLQKIVKPIMNVVAKVSNLFAKLPGVQLLAKDFNAGLNRIGMIFEGIENILMPALRAIERIFDTINRVNDSVFFKPINNFYDKLTELFKDGTTKIRKEIDRFVYSDIIGKVKNGTELSEKDNQLLEEIKRDETARQALLDAIKAEMDVEYRKLPASERVNDIKGLPDFGETLTVRLDDETEENLSSLLRATEGLTNSLDADSDTPWSSADSATPNYNNSYNALKELYDKIYDEWPQTAANLEKISLQDFIKKVNEMTSGVVDEFEKQRQELKDQAKVEYDKQLAEGKAENQEELDRAFSSIDKAIDQLQEKAFEDYKKAFDDKTINAIQKDLTEVEKIANNTKKLEKELNEAVKNGTVKGKQRVELENDIIAVLKNDLDKSAKGLSANIESAANSILNITSSDKIGEAMKDYRLSIETVSKNIEVLDEKIKKIGDDASALDKQKRKEYETTKTVLEGILTAAENNLKVAEHFADVMFEPLKELAEETTNSIGNINGGSVATFYSTNEKAKADIANYRKKADQTFNYARETIVHNSDMTNAEKKTAIEKAAADKESAKATAEQMEATRKATATTEAFILAMSLAADALNTAADSIASNLEAEGDSERAADVKEGAQIFQDSVNNFMDGMSEGGPIMGLIEMIIGWIMELIERLAPLMQSLETGFASIANVFDGVAAVLSPAVMILEYISAPITMLVELLSVVFKLLQPILKVVQKLMKPLNAVLDTIQSWGQNWFTDYTEHQEITVEGFDELVSQTQEIADNVKSLADAADKVRSVVSSINKAATDIRTTISNLIDTTYNKDTLRGVYEATISQIENQQLFKDDSVNLELYKSLFDDAGNVNQEVGNRILLRLQHAELDSQDFYAGTGEKLKDLVSQLMSLQKDQDSGYKSLEESVADILASEQSLAEYETELKNMLAKGGLDADSENAIKGTLNDIQDVRTDIANFKKEFGGTSDADKTTIIGKLKDKITEVAKASDENMAQLNQSYFGGQSSLGKLEEGSYKALTSIEGYVRTIRDYLMQKEQEALIASRKDELYKQYKAAVDAIDYSSGNFQNDGFDENAFLSSMKNYIDGLSDSDISDNSIYGKLKDYATNFDIDGSRYSFYNGSSAYKNAASYRDEAKGAMDSILNETKIMDFVDNTKEKVKVELERVKTYANRNEEWAEWGAIANNNNASNEWYGLRSVLSVPIVDSNGEYAKKFETLTDTEWEILRSYFTGKNFTRSAVKSLLDELKNIPTKEKSGFNSALKSCVNDYAATYNYAKFSKGGWTGNIPIDKISGFVHGQEYVVKAPYAADYRPALEAINAGRGESVFGSQSALQNVNINIDSTVKANDPLSMINEWNKELRNRNLRLELKKL